MINSLTGALLATARDVFAVTALLLSFQYFVLRKPIPHVKRMLVGVAFVVVGLAMFLIGLEMALFPLGQHMATELSSPEFVFGTDLAPDSPPWWEYAWVYLFAAIIGFSTTLAEPALIAVAFKASEASRGAIRPWGLRLVVAVGVAVGISLGTFRIVTGTPLVWYLAAGYFVVLVQTIFRTETDHPAGLRLGRGHDLDRDGATGHGPRARSQWNDSGPKPRTRRIWADCVRKSVPDDRRHGLRSACRVLGPCALEIPPGGMKWTSR